MQRRAHPSSAQHPGVLSAATLLRPNPGPTLWRIRAPRATGPSEKLRPPAEFIISMKDFKNLKRPSSIMSHIAQGYGDDEIERMADFFANIKTGEQK